MYVELVGRRVCESGAAWSSCWRWRKGFDYLRAVLRVMRGGWMLWETVIRKQQQGLFWGERMDLVR
jgi:hypothetical protein